MDVSFFEQLEHDGLIKPEEREAVQRHKEGKLFSVHMEVTTLLSLGVLLFCSGISIFVYKNIDSIGHLTIVALIAAVMAACFVYCFKKRQPYSNERVAAPNVWFDYILLCGSLLLVTFIGYIQLQFHVFGDRWGLTAFIPVVILFFLAYYFDHLGVLSLAITNLAAWAGIATSPMQLVRYSNWGNRELIYSGLLVSALLLMLTALSLLKNIKAHFANTYKNFGIHLFFICALAAMFSLGDYFLLFLLLGAVAAGLWLQSLRQGSFYFLLITILYSYVGLSYMILRTMYNMARSEGMLYLAMLYVIASSVMLIKILVHYNRKLHSNDRIR